MAKINYDGILEAAHFKQDGQLDWVRVYERRGAIFTDRILLNRPAFVEQLKAGKRYRIGERIINMGGNFNAAQPVQLQQRDGKEWIVLGGELTSDNELAGVPII